MRRENKVKMLINLWRFNWFMSAKSFQYDIVNTDWIWLRFYDLCKRYFPATFFCLVDTNMQQSIQFFLAGHRCWQVYNWFWLSTINSQLSTKDHIASHEHPVNLRIGYLVRNPEVSNSECEHESSMCLSVNVILVVSLNQTLCQMVVCDKLFSMCSCSIVILAAVIATLCTYTSIRLYARWFFLTNLFFPLMCLIVILAVGAGNVYD